MTPPLMLFAAGLGTRMGPLVADRPKALVPVAGRALIDHALALADHAQIPRRVVNLHHHAEALRRHLRGRDVILSDETDQLMETGGGLRKALPLLSGSPVLTLNCDAVWSDPGAIAPLTDAWRDGMDGLLLLVPRDRAHGYRGTGDFLLGEDGRLTRGPGLVYTGLQLIRTAALEQIEEKAFSLNRLWDILLDRGTLHGALYGGHWCDVGYPQAIPLAEEVLRAHV